MGRLINAEPYKDCMIVANDEDKGICVNGIPTVDAVPVIRCKDCQYAEPTHDTKGRPCYDTIYCERNDLQAIANWFCADGRKKDGDRDE